jgi:ribonuclease Z
MDHIAGFDGFFRINFNRDTKPVMVWGPAQTIDLMQHRFRSFWWNLHEEQSGSWIVHEIDAEAVRSARMEVFEAFALRHDEQARPADPLIQNDDYRVTVQILDHRGPSAAYRVDEAHRLNVKPERLAASGLRPGPWIQTLKNPAVSGPIDIDGQTRDLGEMRADLLEETPGQSIAYLTDFRLDEAWTERLAGWLAGCDVLVCEAQYAHADAALAAQNSHSTTMQVAELARRADVGRLELFHLSRRYPDFIWREMGREARAIFPRTQFPAAWNL